MKSEVFQGIGILTEVLSLDGRTQRKILSTKYEMLNKRKGRI